MVGISEVRTQLKDLSRYGSGLVGVFVGGTSGIGETTAREFVRYTTKPHVYVVGRSQEAADRLIPEFKSLNADSNIEFIKSDVSLLRNVDDVCKQLIAKEDKINLLCLSAGFFTFQGRQETNEGLDSKLSLHYYSRMRFIQQLLPQLAKAAETPAEGGKQPMSRVISVLGAGLEKQIDLSDFDLKKNYSLARCANHAQTGTTLAMHVLSSQPEAKGVTLIHSAPGGVNTNIGKRAPGLAGIVLRTAASVLPILMPSIMVPIVDSGERHMYAATNDEWGNGGVVLLNQKSDVIPNNGALKELLKNKTEVKVWEHTQEVFKKICDEGGKF
ncbi:uncharacterized protein PV09_00089 [Verruconis gallopava]|uniref:Ketoreductase (KR) domain-containing protein n=1 Tax=Verruconis gallopava TaxID=253628 RepID=A0A0D2AR23_9PEZI|nr:uncharacterized protein PV09_00089 [Verruconis gallopava]KIW09153.1 hypothetical protein PV09_00089 [Verruconis gallopava]